MMKPVGALCLVASVAHGLRAGVPRVPAAPRAPPPRLGAAAGVGDTAADADTGAAAATLAALEWDWDERETWALEDSVPRFSLDGGRRVAWRRLALEVPELQLRSPGDMRARWLAMQAAGGAAPPGEELRLAEELPCLEDWACVGPGRYQGALYGVAGVADGSLRVTVEHATENALAEAPAAPAASAWAEGSDALLFGEGLDGQPRCVRTSSGEVFQLGLPATGDGGEALAVLPSSASERAFFDVGSPWPLDLREAGDTASAAAAGAAGAAKGAGALVAPVLLGGGALLALAAAGYMVLGHHHVDVSVFIV